jgi:DNA-binding GntR family transcriptional regulator
MRESIARGDHAWEGNVLAALHRLSRVTPKTGEHVGEAWWTEHRTFHQALNAACASPWLLHFREVLSDQAERYRRLSLLQPESDTRDVMDEHQALVDAALARDADLACKLFCDHLQITMDLVLAMPELFARSVSPSKVKRSRE